MKDRILPAFGLASALAVGFLATSCGRETTGPSRTALRAAVTSNDPSGFVLQKPNTAVDPSSGEMISTTGAGSFNASGIVASGSFTQFNAAGSVVARGSWAATGFTSFVAFGGPNPGVEGGQLTFSATLFPEGGSPMTGVTVIVTCRVNAPSGFTDEEGTTVGAFTEHIGGTTLFHNE
jgi:hypothetical protein